MRNFKDKWKRYAGFSNREITHLLFTTIILAFIFSFRDWGIGSFNFSSGIENWLKAIIIVGISLYFKQLSHRAMGLWVGYKVEFKAWWLGLIVGVIITFFTNGILIFMVPGILILHHMKFHRLTHDPFASSNRSYGAITIVGPLTNIALAILAKVLAGFFAPDFFFKVMMINLWLAIFSILPIPPLDGIKLLYAFRTLYIFLVAFTLIIAAFLVYSTVLISIVGAVVLAICITTLFFGYVDNEWKTG